MGAAWDAGRRALRRAPVASKPGACGEPLAQPAGLYDSHVKRWSADRYELQAIGICTLDNKREVRTEP